MSVESDRGCGSRFRFTLRRARNLDPFCYAQRFWPAWYLIDADGFVRYKHFGEGAYGEPEEKIRELLAEKERMAG